MPLEIEVNLGQLQNVHQIEEQIEQDNDLARRIAGGDADAWDMFFDRYSAWIYRFAYYHLDRNCSDAEDLCSDILMTAAKSIGKFDPRRGDLDSWLFGLARHRLARFCRGRRIELPFVPDIVDHFSSSEPMDSSLADKVGLRDMVNRTLASIPNRHAAVLVAKYVEGYTTEELARQSEISTKAVESLLVRARAAFRSAFDRLLSGSTGGDNRG